MSEHNRFWLTEFASSAGMIFINKNGESVMIIDGRYFEKAKVAAKNISKFVLQGENKKPFNEQIKEILTSLKIHSLGLEKEYTTLNQLEFFQEIEGIKLFSFNAVQLREVKEEAEIESLQKAADIAAETIEWAKTMIKPGMTEIEIANIISKHMLDLGASKNSFDPIVASGVNGAIPHHHPSEKVVENGEMITLDIGCVYNGFCSDITRSFVLGGKAKNPEILEIYNIVLKSQTEGIKAAKNGATGAEVDKVCRDIISNTKYKDYFVHSTGHGVGIEVHELPNVTKSNTKKLVPNNVVTVEPGIYVPGIGGVRIEDTILITDSDALLLTKKATK